MFVQCVEVLLVAHVCAFVPTCIASDLAWLDAVSGLSLVVCSFITTFEGGGHLIVGVLFALWSLRLSAHVIARRLLLGARRSRCTFPGARDALSFAFGRLAWAFAVAITMSFAPKAYHDSYIRKEFALLALLFLCVEAFADAELLLFRATTQVHKPYMKGMWSICRHPNMMAELLFQACMCIVCMSRTSQPFLEPAALAMTALCVFGMDGGIRTLEQRAEIAWGADAEYTVYKSNTPLLIPTSSSISNATFANT